MDKTIVTGFMIIIAIITSVLLFNAVYPAVLQSSDAMTSMTARIDERMKSDIEIIHATGELDSTGSWQDTNGDGRFNFFVWTKNIGTVRFPAVESMDVFLGPEGNFSRIPHEDNAGGSFPYWTYTIENDSEWNPTATLAITIHYSATQPSGRYFAKIITPNGVESQIVFSI